MADTPEEELEVQVVTRLGKNIFCSLFDIISSIKGSPL